MEIDDEEGIKKDTSGEEGPPDEAQEDGGEDEEDSPIADDLKRWEEDEAEKPLTWASAPVFGTVVDDEPLPPVRPVRATLGPILLTEEGTTGYYLLGGANLEVNISKALALFGSVIFGVGPDILAEYGLVYVGFPQDAERGTLGAEKGTAPAEGDPDAQAMAQEQRAAILPKRLAPPAEHEAQSKDETDAIRAAGVMKKLPHGPYVGSCWKIELRDIYRRLDISKARALELMDVLEGWGFTIVYNYGGSEIAINVTQRYSQTQFVEETKEKPARWRWDEGREDTWPKIF